LILNDSALAIVYLCGCLVLVGSALIARHLPMAETVRMVLVWVGLFALAALVIHYFT
jgi:hypothetical protein